jgi:cell division control protein 6
MTPVKTPGRGRKGGWAAGGVADERRFKSAVGVKELMGVVESGVAGELLREMVEGGR